MTSQFACGSKFQSCYATDGGRDFMCGQALSTDLQDLALEVRNSSVRAALTGLFFQNDVGGDQRTGNGISSGMNH